MTLRIRWHPTAEEVLKHIGWHPAERVDAAVIRFAATGLGEIHRSPLGEYRLRIGPYDVWFTVDRGEGVMDVVSVHGPRRKAR